MLFFITRHFYVHMRARSQDGNVVKTISKRLSGDWAGQLCRRLAGPARANTHRKLDTVTQEGYGVDPTTFRDPDFFPGT